MKKLATGSTLDYYKQLTKIEMIGDGHCLFRAISWSITGNQESYQRYRNLAADFIDLHLDEFLDFIAPSGDPATYLEELRANRWGDEPELKALSRVLHQRIEVFKHIGKEILHYIHSGEEDIKNDRPTIYLSLKGTEENGHYDVLVDKATSDSLESRAALKTLTEKLRTQERELKLNNQHVIAPLQTSFLKRDILQCEHLYCTDLLPILETIEEIGRLRRWFDDDTALQLIYDVLCDLQPAEVLGVPEENMFRRSPVVFALNLASWLIYYPILFILMLLLLLGRIQGWVALITGFAGAIISAVSMQDDTIALASYILGIITGILVAAKSLSLEKDGKIDYLYPRAEDLTIEVLRLTLGNISKDAVFQKYWDRKKAFNKFAMTLSVKKADIRKVQNVRIFLAVVISTSLVGNPKNFAYMDSMQTVSKRIEGILINPHNYLTSQDLEGEDPKYDQTPAQGKEDENPLNYLTSQDLEGEDPKQTPAQGKEHENPDQAQADSSADKGEDAQKNEEDLEKQTPAQGKEHDNPEQALADSSADKGEDAQKNEEDLEKGQASTQGQGNKNARQKQVGTLSQKEEGNQNNRTSTPRAKNEKEMEYGFKEVHVRQIRDMWREITPLQSFCSFLKALNSETGCLFHNER